MTLILSKAQIALIEREGVEAYPNECCGALLGKDVSGSSARRVVSEVRPLRNAHESDEQFNRFSLDARDLMELEKTATLAGLVVLGFYHSHPDHPAKPSKTDLKSAWPFYSYVIVSIEKGKPADLTSWQLDETTEEFKPETVERSAT
jgi:proteasome lid subunit RPN8/RPN11